VEKEKPNFDLVTINPPLVLGPIVHYLNSLNALNTSNEKIRDFIQGKAKDGLPDSAMPMWIDVRDTAVAHVNAIEKPEFGGKRVYFTAGYGTNRAIADAIRNNFPEYKDVIPATGGEMGDFAKFDNARAQKLLGAPFTSIEKSTVDLIKSLKEVGA
jgi:nucleoside-diphosphate-sugar epimerase